MDVVQIIGMGTVVMNPVIGNLSDLYGRKSLLTLPLTLSIIPLGTFASLIRFLLLNNSVAVSLVLFYCSTCSACVNVQYIKSLELPYPLFDEAYFNLGLYYINPPKNTKNLSTL